MKVGDYVGRQKILLEATKSGLIWPRFDTSIVIIAINRENFPEYWTPCATTLPASFYRQFDFKRLLPAAGSQLTRCCLPTTDRPTGLVCAFVNGEGRKESGEENGAVEDVRKGKAVERPKQLPNGVEGTYSEEEWREENATAGEQIEGKEKRLSIELTRNPGGVKREMSLRKTAEISVIRGVPPQPGSFPRQHLSGRVDRPQSQGQIGLSE